MIERVAKEIYDILPYNEPGKKPAWVERGNSLKQDVARVCAREIIKTMREPTEAMGVAAEECPDDCWGTWSTMIDAALESGK